jgi:hypothetical protein
MGTLTKKRKKMRLRERDAASTTTVHYWVHVLEISVFAVFDDERGLNNAKLMDNIRTSLQCIARHSHIN